MRIVIAPDKFKHCLSASQVAEAVAAGWRRVRTGDSLDLCPMSDGGEGFVDAMTRACGGRTCTREVTGPLPEMKVEATFAVLDAPASDGAATGVVEMSAASGIALLPRHLRDPEATTTFGTGQLLLAAAEAGCRRILLGVGGSATIDGGIGCCHAAGLPVLLDGGEPTSLTEPLCGRDLPRVVGIKSHRGERLAGVDITVCCDVSNPLCGPNGAARVFGPQKGATPAQVEQFDVWLAQLSRRCGKDETACRPGAGAAGGLGFGMMAFFGASMRPGAEMVIDATGLRERLRGADLCITGEGSLDHSSLGGKAPIRVAQLCRELGVKCYAITGSLNESTPPVFEAVLTARQLATSDEDSHARASELIASCGERFARSV